MGEKNDVFTLLVYDTEFWQNHPNRKAISFFLLSLYVYEICRMFHIFRVDKIWILFTRASWKTSYILHAVTPV